MASVSRQKKFNHAPPGRPLKNNNATTYMAIWTAGNHRSVHALRGMHSLHIYRKRDTTRV